MKSPNFEYTGRNPGTHPSSQNVEVFFLQHHAAGDDDARTIMSIFYNNVAVWAHYHTLFFDNQEDAAGL